MLSQGWGHALLVLVVVDAVALVWFLIFVAPEPSIHRWEVIAALIGMGMETLVIPQVVTRLFAPGGLANSIALLRERPNQIQVVLSTVFVVAIVPPVCRVSFQAVDSFSGKPLDSAEVWQTDDKPTRVRQGQLFRSGHYTFVLKKPPNFRESAPVSVTLTPVNLFRPGYISVSLEPIQMRVQRPGEPFSQLFIRSAAGWQELVDIEPEVPAGCRQFRIIFPDGRKAEGFVALRAENRVELLNEERLKPACPPEH